MRFFGFGLFCNSVKMTEATETSLCSHAGTPSTYKGIPLEKLLLISACIPLLLLSETWMIWLLDDSLFLKSVSAPYVSNVRLARRATALPWGLWGAGAVFKPGGRIVLWAQTLALQMRIGLNSSACSRKWLPIAMHFVCYHSLFFCGFRI